MVAHSWGRNALFGGSQLKERARLLKAGKARLSLCLKEGKVQNKRHFEKFCSRGGMVWMLIVNGCWMVVSMVISVTTGFAPLERPGLGYLRHGGQIYLGTAFTREINPW